MRLFIITLIAALLLIVLTGLIPQLRGEQTFASATIIPTAPTQNAPVAQAQPTQEPSELVDFSRSLANGNPFQVVGIYTPGLFSLPVVQQPAGESAYVSTIDQSLTQFALTDQYHSIGLLAHNYLSGSLFFDLNVGETVIVVYGDGQTSSYRVSAVEKYQALDSSSPYSDFIDLADSTRQVISSSRLFAHIYTAPNRVVFQTCIAQGGDASWGRLFVTAEKVDSSQAWQAKFSISNN